MNIILWIVVVLFVAGVIAMAYAGLTAEDGYEDENGFQSGEEQTNKQNSKND